MTGFLGKSWALIAGPQDADGRTNPARPLIILGVAVAVLAFLTWLTKGWILIMLIVIIGVSFAMASTRRDEMRARQAAEIRSYLSAAHVTSTYDVARNLGIDVSEVEAIIANMIDSANQGRKANNPDEQFLRNARLDRVAHKVTLDPRANDSLLDKLTATASTLLGRGSPAVASPEPDWRCTFCRRPNVAGSSSCSKCGGARPGAAHPS